MTLLHLTCASDKEAKKIATTLLEKKLVVCTKRYPVSSIYRWKGKIESSKEVLLIMETTEEKFNEIEKEVKKIHSYTQFVLVSTPVSKYGNGVDTWVKEGLK